MPQFSLNQLVWVRTSETGDHEETARVLDPQHVNDEDEAEDHGILVQLVVAGHKMSYPVSRVRALEQEEDEDEKSNAERRTSRRNRRSVITPSPKTVVSASLQQLSSFSTTTSNSCPRSVFESVTNPASDEDAKPEISRATKVAPATKAEDKEERKPAAKRKQKDIATEIATEKPAASKKKPSRAVVIALHNDSSEESVAAEAEEHPVDEDEHKVFQIDYAPTSRASCRRCDSNISKGDLRISHMPLFRGKPGFRIYRHLHCAVFDETVHSVQDVGGWRQLQSEQDREVLALRIEEAKMELEQENEELEPDELVCLFVYS